MSERRDFEQPPQSDEGLFGTVFEPASHELIVIGVPWEPTASYGRGTSRTPRAILEPSHQLDFYDPRTDSVAVDRIGMSPISVEWERMNARALELAAPIIAAGGTGKDDPRLEEVNSISARLNQSLKTETLRWLEQGKAVGILGGDHSAPFGAMLAQDECALPWAVLHIDAHHDLRDAYEGFSYSHASVMFNLLKESKHLSRLVSVGIRDYAASEAELAASDERIETFYDRDLARASFAGESWQAQCNRIVDLLPERVYVSFDIDGLQPDLCPHTGTPVPGGLSFNQALGLLETVVDTGRQLIGFDLCEVSPGPKPTPVEQPAYMRPDGEWDLNVGARLLYRLCALTLESSANR